MLEAILCISINSDVYNNYVRHCHVSVPIQAMIVIVDRTKKVHMDLPQIDNTQLFLPHSLPHYCCVSHLIAPLNKL